MLIVALLASSALAAKPTPTPAPIELTKDEEAAFTVSEAKLTEASATADAWRLYRDAVSAKLIRKYGIKETDTWTHLNGKLVYAGPRDVSGTAR